MYLYLWISITISVISPTRSVSQLNQWFPADHSVTPVHLSNVFYHVDGETLSTFPTKLTQVVNTVLTKGYDNRAAGEWFQWYTVTAFRESNKPDGDSWLVLGGSVPTMKSDSNNPFTKYASGVMSCRFTPKSSSAYGFVFQDCEPLDLQYVHTVAEKTTGGAGLLGIGLASLQLNEAKGGAVLVYCDPLWRADGLHAGGQCHMRLRNTGHWSNLTHAENLQFCTSSGHSQPCGGGLSVDLLQTNIRENSQNGLNDGNLPHVKLIVGLPLAQPHGEVQLIDNILNRYGDARTVTSSIHRILGSREKFGTKVSWTPEMSLKANRKRQLSIVSALRTLAQSTFHQWTQESLALITSGDEDRVLAFRHSQSSQTEKLFDIEPPMKDKAGDSQTSNFGTGFGQAIDTVIVPADTNALLQRAEYAILLGAPFQSSSQRGPNFGRVYILCPGMSNLTEKLNYINGKDSQSFFGYSVVRLGDVDGDGIDDVAIGAPGLHGPTKLSNDVYEYAPVAGKVYIHRVTSQCQLDPEPIQILTAPNSEPGDGFGVGLARGVDVDSDGWPELFVTSLRFNQAPYVYTMPRRLRAQCQISVPPGYGMTPFQAGTKIPVTVMVRLFDQYKNNWVQIPEGVTSTEVRMHQINPDILWQELLTNRTEESLTNYQEKDAESFFASLVNSELDLFKPRFFLKDNEISAVSLSSDRSQMYVRADLLAQYAAQSIDLSTVPLRVGYRSYLNADTCPTLHTGHPLCIKHEQPLIDWSSCNGEIKLDQHICVPDPECLADVRLEQFTQSGTNQSSRETEIPLEFGNPKVRQQLVRFRLVNQGPTKTTGVRIQLRVIGRSSSERTVGVQLAITHVVLDNDQYGMSNRNTWSITIAEDGSAALISSKSHHWIYPNESFQFNVSLFVAELQETVNIPEDQRELEIGNRTYIKPSLAVRVLSAIKDPNADNDEFFVRYNLTYEPRVEISAGVQPSTIIDNRKSATLTKSKPPLSKVFSHEIGPKVEHMFLVENRGQTTLYNLTLVLDLPMKTANDELLLYLTDRARLVGTGATSTQWENMLPHLVGANEQNLGQCTVPDEYLNQFNFSILNIPSEGHRMKRTADVKSSAENVPRAESRSRRDVTIQRLDDPESEIETDIPLISTHSSSHSSTTAFQRTERGRIHLRCPPLIHTQSGTGSDSLSNWHKCVEIRCNLDRLDKGDTVRLRWSGWLWAATYFNRHVPDVQLVSRLRVADWGYPSNSIKFYQLLANRQPNRKKLEDLIVLNYPEEMPSFELKQSIIFRNVHPDVIHQVPWWPIVVGVVVGSLLLAALGACCYYCGFFRRKRIPGKLEAKRSGGILSPSNYRLLSNNEDDADNNGKSNVPSFLSTKPPTGAGMYLNSKPIHGKHEKPHRKAPDQTEFLVPASPNLLCAEEPEPPSPKIPTSTYVTASEWVPEDHWTDHVQEPAETEVEPTKQATDSAECRLHDAPSTGSDGCTNSEERSECENPSTTE